jgi:hypothetical protein
MLSDYRLLYAFGPNKGGAWEASCGIGNPTKGWAVVGGWGHDHEMPLSLYPQYVSKILPKSHSHYRCFSWCGFFICYGVL